MTTWNEVAMQSACFVALISLLWTSKALKITGIYTNGAKTSASKRAASGNEMGVRFTNTHATASPTHITC